MQSTAPEHLPDHAFWHFTEKMRQNIKVRDSLLQLQTQAGIQINLLLFCCWFASAGLGRFTKPDAQQLIEMIATWNARIVLPFAQLQMRFAKSTLPKAVKHEIAETGLLIDRLEQLMLTDMPSKFTRSVRTPMQKFTDACKNVATYCKAKQVSINSSTFEHMYQLLVQIFPAINLVEAREICESILLAETSNYAQATLELN